MIASTMRIGPVRPAFPCAGADGQAAGRCSLRRGAHARSIAARHGFEQTPSPLCVADPLAAPAPSLIAVPRPAAPRARGAAIARNSGVSRMSSGRSAGRSLSMMSVMRPGRGDITTMRGREEHRLGDRVGDEDHRLLGLRPELQQLLVQMVAHDLVERAERLVHQQQVGIEGERAGDRGALLHAAGQLPGKLLLEAREIDQRRACASMRSFRSARGTPMISSGSATFRSMVRQG